MSAAAGASRPDLCRPEIILRSGRVVCPLALTPADVDVVDIAHGLAQTNRWHGQARYPYSVAQHAANAAKAAAVWLGDPDTVYVHTRRVALAALHHDSGEAYLGDIAAPMKPFTRFRRAVVGSGDTVDELAACTEAQVVATIEAALGMPPCTGFPLVAEIDAALAGLEARALFDDPPPALATPTDLERRLAPWVDLTEWSWRRAAATFYGFDAALRQGAPDATAIADGRALFGVPA